MKFKNVTWKEFFKLLGILFCVIFIVSVMFLNYLVDHNYAMYGFVIQDSVSIFGIQFSQKAWIVIVSFIVTLVCSLVGVLLGFIGELLFELILNKWKNR